MEKFKRSFSMRKKRDTSAESSKPHQWQEDERKVREGSCSFQVKYLGCIEVFESRGIQICEEAVKALKSKKSRSVWSRLSMRKKRDGSQQSKSSHHRAILYVTGDALRVVDEISKGLIVDQTIEKVSFCAPDRNHEKGFAYICRDGTTRRWMCHGFFAVKESGERLSHAVGCAFAICLEKKQQREKEKVTVTYNENGTSFTRMGSFRQTTLTERLADPQSAILAEPVPLKKVENPFAVQRPHAPVDLIERQGSFRGFTRLADTSPFKRNISLRLNELPSTLDRQRQAAAGFLGPQQSGSATGNSGFSVIMEAEEQSDSQSPVANACSQLSERLAALGATGNATGFSTAVNGNGGIATMPQFGATASAAGGPGMAPPGGTYPTNMGTTSATFIPAVAPTQAMPIGMATMMQPGAGYMVQPGIGGGFVTSPQPQFAALPRTTPVVTAASPFTTQHSVNNSAANRQFSPFSPAVSSSSSPGPVVPMRISNPWAGSGPGGGATTDQPSPPPVIAAPVSVHSTAASSPNPGKVSQAEFWLNSTANQIDPFAGVPSIGTKQASARSRSVVNGVPEQAAAVIRQPSMPTGATGAPFTAHPMTSVAIATVHHQGAARCMNTAGANVPATTQNHVPAPQFPVAFTQDTQPHNTRPAAPAFDPFDSAWAAKSSGRPAASVATAPINNPFQQSADKLTPAFQVQL